MILLRMRMGRGPSPARLRRRPKIVLMIGVRVIMAMTVAAHVTRRVGGRQEPCGSYAGAQHPLRRHLAVLDRQAAKRLPQPVERESEVEQRAEHHVAGRPGETVEV